MLTNEMVFCLWGVEKQGVDQSQGLNIALYKRLPLVLTQECTTGKRLQGRLTWTIVLPSKIQHIF